MTPEQWRALSWLLVIPAALFGGLVLNQFGWTAWYYGALWALSTAGIVAAAAKAGDLA